jgi:hypothetical protein
MLENEKAQMHERPESLSFVSLFDRLCRLHVVPSRISVRWKLIVICIFIYIWSTRHFHHGSTIQSRSLRCLDVTGHKKWFNANLASRHIYIYIYIYIDRRTRWFSPVDIFPWIRMTQCIQGEAWPIVQSIVHSLSLYRPIYRPIYLSRYHGIYHISITLSI